MVIVQELWPDSKAPGYWREIGRAKDIEEAERIARRHYDPEGFGGFRHPDGGPKYGTIRAILEEGEVLIYDGYRFLDSSLAALINKRMAEEMEDDDHA